MFSKVFFLFVLFLGSAFSSGDETDATNGDEPLDSSTADSIMEFKTPDMTEEEQHSNHMPLHMLCDGCKLIAKKVRLTSFKQPNNVLISIILCIVSKEI